MFVGFLQAQTVVENFTQKTPLVVLPDILVKTILIKMKRLFLSSFLGNSRIISI